MVDLIMLKVKSLFNWKYLVSDPFIHISSNYNTSTNYVSWGYIKSVDLISLMKMIFHVTKTWTYFEDSVFSELFMRELSSAYVTSINLMMWKQWLMKSILLSNWNSGEKRGGGSRLEIFPEISLNDKIQDQSSTDT